MVATKGPHHEKWSCLRKVKYKTEKMAALMTVMRLPKDEHRLMNVYHCQYCQHYHIGHKPQRVKSK